MSKTQIEEFLHKQGFCIRVATKQDVGAIHQVMERVYFHLEDKSIYICDDLEFVKRHIDEEGFVVVISDRDNRMVASLMVRYPGLSDDNLGRDILLNDCELEKVVHMESVVVLPEYRGSSFQLKMLQYAEECIDQERYFYYMATVSPNNPASFISLEKQGYQRVCIKDKYNGVLRGIYLKKKDGLDKA